jgi:hypothetical protein
MTTVDYNEIFKEISNGDPYAYDFCRTLFEWVHASDDLIDKDKEISLDFWIHANIKLLDMAGSNPFFRKHHKQLMVVIRSSALAYVASEKYRKHDDVRNVLAAEVLKSEYQNVFFEVAFLTGGFSFQRAISEKYRDYHWG